MHRWIAGIAFAAMTAHAQEAALPTGFLNTTTEIDGDTRQHVVYVPDTYTPDEAWPLILFLHGAGERGDDGLKQTQVGLASAIRMNEERFPAIVLFPQCPENRYWNAIEGHLDALLAQARERYRIDDDRVYLTGLSMGGYGCWTWGATRIDQWAAMIPICGGGNAGDMNRLVEGEIPEDAYPDIRERVEALATIPIWTFHGLEDRSVPPIRTKQMVRMIEKEGGNIKHTEYEGVGHNSWDEAYNDPLVVWWLFEQRRDAADE